jgi:AraC-like DNA-binding protein
VTSRSDNWEWAASIAVKAAAQMLHLEEGRFRLADLAEQCNLSGRQLQRQFQETVGMSPKALARVIRFEAIRRRLMFNPDQSLTALAHEFEYSDQAHFTHDFKELAGRTPREFAREMRRCRIFSEITTMSFFYKHHPSIAS